MFKLGVPENKIPSKICTGSKYDDKLMEFGKKLIDSEEYLNYKPKNKLPYSEFGSMKDTLTKRLESNIKSGFEPLMRAHVGPFLSCLLYTSV